MMRRFLFLALSFLVVMSDARAKPEAVHYQIQVYRLSDGYRSDLSLETDIWQSSKEKWETMQDDVTLFDHGLFSWGKNAVLSATSEKLMWNQETVTPQNKTLLPGERVKLIYSPDFIKKNNELARLKIEAKTPFQYLQQREDGLLEVHEMHLPVGLDLEIKSVKRRDKVYLVSYLEIELRSVGKREPIPGLNLDVGRPILNEWEYIMELELQEKKSYYIMLKPEGISGTVIIRIEVEGA